MSNVLEKLQKGKEEKDKGNEEFKKGNIVPALRHYHQATLFLTGLDNAELSSVVPSEHLEANVKTDIKDTLKACYSNMAACYLKQAKFDKCINSCDKIVKTDGSNAKAYYRRGAANLQLNNLDASLSDLKKAAELAPQDKGIRDELKNVTEKIKALDEKSKQELRGIFLDKSQKEK